jgi:hypothetical protein
LRVCRRLEWIRHQGGCFRCFRTTHPALRKRAMMCDTMKEANRIAVS